MKQEERRFLNNLLREEARKLKIARLELSTASSSSSAFRAGAPEKVEFVPLNCTELMNGRRLMEVFSTHQQLKAYLPIIRDSPVYPIIYDAKRRVLFWAAFALRS